MSLEVLRLIPTDPTHVPTADGQRAGEALLASIVPEALEVSSSTSESVEFVDCGGNSELIGCPICGEPLDDDWFTTAMDKAYETQFEDLKTRLPCCETRVSLNDLKFNMPMGFSRYILEARDPGLGRSLTATELLALEGAVGCGLREIWAHY